MTVPDRWQQPIFIASMGRSGSTLLQRVLNVHPDITIWGEHGGFLSGILTSYRTTTQPAVADNLIDGYEHRQVVVGELREKAIFKPWVSPFVPDDLQNAVRELTTGLFTRELDESIRWGFKEIRYNAEDLRTLLTIFPKSHMVILGREVTGYAQSRFFAFGNTDFDLETDGGRAQATKRLETMIGGWIARYRGLLSLRDDFPNRTSVVSYGSLVPESDRAMRLFAELGEAAPNEDALLEVLGSVSGSSYKFNSRARAARGSLAELVAQANIDREEIARISEALDLT